MSTQNLETNTDITNFYTPTDATTYNDIIKSLKNDTIDVAFKIYDLHSKSTFVYVQGNDLAIFKKFNYEYEPTVVYCTFIYGSEKYFFRSQLSTSENHYLVKKPEKIYKLQRRKDYRFTIPFNLSHSIKLIEHPELECTLRDISLGGCRFSVKTPHEINFQIESDLNITLKILDFGAVTIDCTVAYTRFINENSTQLVGIKFGSIDAEYTSALHKTLIQVDRIVRGGPISAN